MNIPRSLKRIIGASGATMSIAALAISGGSAYAASSQTTDAQRLQTIITKGDQEIARRLTTLSTLTSKINAASKLTTSDKTALSAEVSNAISGLSALKTKLDAETTVAGARADAQSIFDEYRVYALVAPKVALIKTADDQQAVQTKLAALATKLQTRITAAQKSGKDVAQLQTELADMTSKTAAAQAISSSVEHAVIGLQPSDYNSDHNVLSGYRTQLQTAHTDNQAAVTDAKSIAAALKNL